MVPPNLKVARGPWLCDCKQTLQNILPHSKQYEQSEDVLPQFPHSVGVFRASLMASRSSRRLYRKLLAHESKVPSGCGMSVVALQAGHSNSPSPAWWATILFRHYKKNAWKHGRILGVRRNSTQTEQDTWLSRSCRSFSILNRASVNLFSFYSFVLATYIIQTHRCCQSDDR